MGDAAGRFQTRFTVEQDHRAHAAPGIKPHQAACPVGIARQVHARPGRGARDAESQPQPAGKGFLKRTDAFKLGLIQDRDR